VSRLDQAPAAPIHDQAPSRARVPTEAVHLEAIDEEAARPAWTALAKASGNFFATMEFVQAWQAWAGDPVLRLASIRGPDHRFAGLLTTVIDQRGPLRILRFAGYELGDQLGPTGHPDDVPLLSAGLRAYLDMTDRYDLFLGERLPGDWDWAGDLGAVELKREGFPLQPVLPGEDWEGILSRVLSAKRRKHVRRILRQADELGELRLRRTRDAASLPDDFATFLRLHEAHWGSQSSLLPRVKFLRQFAEVALDREWLRLWILEIDGQPVASLFDVEFAGVYAGYNGGRDPAWNDASVGHVIWLLALQEELRSGIREFRFLRGAEPYKYRFAKVDPGLVTVGRARTPLGHAALAGLRLARSQGWLRALLRRAASPSDRGRPAQEADGNVEDHRR
jgi:CelD/BcsL family acetyltransferase involved in cellulose biosynthesis